MQAENEKLKLKAEKSDAENEKLREQSKADKSRIAELERLLQEAQNK